MADRYRLARSDDDLLFLVELLLLLLLISLLYFGFGLLCFGYLFVVLVLGGVMCTCAPPPPWRFFIIGMCVAGHAFLKSVVCFFRDFES